MYSSSSVGSADVARAAAALAGVVHRTPLMTSRTLDELAGCQLVLKCENLQRVGAFKYRGAAYAVSRLSAAEAARGVVTHSSGNHAQALALAARERGVPAYIVMPSTAPPIKRRAVEGYGATVIECPPTLEARETAAAQVQAETGARFIHPYDDDHVIAGQGSMACELLEQDPQLDAVVVPVGGGGLLSGTCLAIRSRAAGVHVWAAEPLGADDAARSLAAGERIPQTNPNTVADGLLTSLGERNWPIIRENVQGVLTVSDPQILAALRLLLERVKLVVEPSGAVALAAVLAHRDQLRAYRRVAVVLSGGNLDLLRLGELLHRVA